MKNSIADKYQKQIIRKNSRAGRNAEAINLLSENV